MINIIYVLIDPRNNSIRYVGVTCKSIHERLSGHIRTARHDNRTRRDRWINCLSSQGLRPIIACIEETSDRNRECFWIEYYANQGCDLTNHTVGGEGVPGYRHTEATKAILSEKSRAYNSLPEVRQKHSLLHKGKVMSTESRERMSKSQTGRKHSPQTRLKMRKPKAPESMAVTNAALARARSTGTGGVAKGDRNGLRLHPESVLRGSENPIAKLTENDVRNIRKAVANGEKSMLAISKDYSVSFTAIWKIVHRRAWKHVD